ncbi:MAG: zinc-binding alcohol dehydrogenase [Actinomycetota bacterium]
MIRARALEFAAPRDVRLVELELAEPRADEIVVRTLYSGISTGTELLAYRGQIDPDLPLDEEIGTLTQTFSYPFRYGYGCVGIVERSNAAVGPGTVVAVLHPHQDRLVCRPADAVPVPAADARLATMLPLVETALQITLDVGDAFADPVVVTGLGSVGLLTALLLQRAGARVVGVDPVRARRLLAGDVDVEAVAPDAAPDRVASLTAGHGVPVVVEASGNPAALASSLPLLAHEGTALVASWYGTKPVTLALGRDFHRRRLTIRSTQVSTIPARLSARWTIERRRKRAAALLAELPLKRLATHEVPFERAPEAFRMLDRGDGDVMHVALAYERS